jgi:hypothetical protein
MKGKAGQDKRQAANKAILRTYGSVDRVDAICLGARFHVAPEVIAEDVRNVSEALRRELLVQERAAKEVCERQAELTLARKILRDGGV